MIVTCPNCAARYRLSEEAIAQKGRLRCAACDHRWVPETAPEAALAVDTPKPPAPVTDADEEAAFLAVQEQIRARWQDAATPVAAMPQPREIAEATVFDEPQVQEEEEPRESSKILRTVIAVIAGTALAIAAGGLWIGRQDLSALPVIGQAINELRPVSAVKITAAAETTLLPSGRHVLEVNGAIANPGQVRAMVPPLTALLSGPQGVALRWTIPAPVPSLEPGQQVAFTSTVTGYPGSARTLTVKPAR